jgi:hypothetical protein
LTRKFHPGLDNRGYADVRQAGRMERKATGIFALDSIFLLLFFVCRMTPLFQVLKSIFEVIM